MIAVNESGDYYVEVDAQCTVDQIQSEAVTITILDGPDMPVADDVELSEPGTATLEATGDNLIWYETEDAIDLVGEGTTFETSFIDAGNSVSYWVEANTIYGGELGDGGKEDNSGGGGIPSSGGKLFFNSDEAFTLLEVTIYVPDEGGAGERTIQLFDQNTTLIAEHTEFFEVGTHEVELNFAVPEGQGLSIGATPNTLFRNNEGVQYPYEIGTVGSIYDSTFGGSYYYYFYDWKIQLEETICSSPRVEVTATVTVVGIENVGKLDGFEAYPNPASDVLNLSFNLNSESEVTIQMLDVSGNIVQDMDLGVVSGELMKQLDTQALAAGAYILQVSFDGQLVHQRILKD
jgi:hypothetical protein